MRIVLAATLPLLFAGGLLADDEGSAFRAYVDSDLFRKL